MESVTIIFSMFRLVFVEILNYGVRYTLIIAKMRAVPGFFCTKVQILAGVLQLPLMVYSSGHQGCGCVYV